MGRGGDPPPFLFAHWEYLDPLRKHMSFVVVFVVSAILSALALTYIYSEKYEATVTLVMSAGEVTRLQFRGDKTEAFGAPMPVAEFKVIGKTLEDLASSERLLRKVVDEFDLDVPEDRSYEGPWYVRYYKMLKDYGKDYSLDAWAFLKYGRIPEEDPTAKAVVKLSQDVTVLNEDSYVFHLKVLDKHPIRVALIADFLAEQLVVIANEADSAPAAEKRVELEALRDQKRDEINAYRATINDILTANRLTSVSQEMQERLGELYALEAEQTRLKAEIEAERHELADLDARLAAVDEVAKGGRTRNRDGSAFGRLQPEDINRMSSDKLFSEVELEGLEARSAALALSIVQTRARLEELPDLRLEIEQLEADLERVNGEYEQINVALNELVIQESESVAELRIQNPATQPTAPVTPIKIYHVGLAAVLGLTLSIGLVYVFTYFNVRIFVPSGGPKMRRYPPPASKGNIVAQAISNADQRRAEPAGGAAAAGVETGDLTGAPTPRPT